MQLDRLAVQLRLRNPWEAIDLGFAMVRTWARTVYAAWLTLFVPLCVLALLVLPWQWAIVLVWWLKPALDRVVLHVLAAGVFGDLPRLRDTLRALPRALTPGLIASLTWYRFFLVRSFNLPVWQLERQTGAEARERRRQLHRRTSGHAAWLTTACVLFELVLALSGNRAVRLARAGAAKRRVPVLPAVHLEGPEHAAARPLRMVFAGMAIVEPFYVAGGFALYLNRRTALEGWDLEVALRRMGERAQAVSRSVDVARAAALALVLAGLLALQSPADGYAQGASAAEGGGDAQVQPGAPPAEAPTTTGAAGAAVGTACAGVGRDRTGAVAAARGTRDQGGAQASRVRSIPRAAGAGVPRQAATAQACSRRIDSAGWAAFIEGLAQFLRILAYAAIALAVIFLLYYLLRRFDLLGRERSSYVPPATLFGLDVRPESLPDDVAGAALELARAGDLLKALSLLYRGALVTLLHRDGVELASGDTEDDCLRKSRKHIPDPSLAYFARLLATWQRLAYARRQVPNSEVEALCGDWRAHFAAASQGTAL